VAIAIFSRRGLKRSAHYMDHWIRKVIRSDVMVVRGPL